MKFYLADAGEAELSLKGRIKYDVAEKVNRSVIRVKALREDIRIADLVNYGTRRKPSYTIRVEMDFRVNESPDMMHRIFTETGLISRETIPFEIVNFRGSASGNAPFYAADIMHECVLKNYRVDAREAGGIRALRYEPVVTPEDLRLIHPAEFHRHGIEVLSWEIHNYRPHLMLFITSKRYESFDIAVQRDESGITSISINLVESDLREKIPPCRWLLPRISVFGTDIDDDLMKLLAA